MADRTEGAGVTIPTAGRGRGGILRLHHLLDGTGRLDRVRVVAVHTLYPCSSGGLVGIEDVVMRQRVAASREARENIAANGAAVVTGKAAILVLPDP